MFYLTAFQLHFCMSHIKQNSFFTANTFLGPYDGIRIPFHGKCKNESLYVWEVEQGIGRFPEQKMFRSQIIDGQFTEVSNWIRLFKNCIYYSKLTIATKHEGAFCVAL